MKRAQQQAIKRMQFGDERWKHSERAIKDEATLDDTHADVDELMEAHRRCITSINHRIVDETREIQSLEKQLTYPGGAETHKQLCKARTRLDELQKEKKLAVRLLDNAISEMTNDQAFNHQEKTAH